MLVVATPSANDNSGIMSAIDQLDKTTIAPMSFEEWKNRVSIHRKRKPQMPSPPSIESADLDEEDIEVDDDDFEEDVDDLDMDGVEYAEDEMDDAASDLVDQHDIYHAPTIINNDDSVKKAEFHTPKRKRRIRRFGAWTILTDPSAKGSQRLSISPTLSDITTHHLDSTPTSPKTTIIDPGVQAEQSNPYELHEESPYSSQNREQDNHAETGYKVSNDGAQETFNHEEAGTESVDGGAHSEVEREDGTLNQDADDGDSGQAEEDPNVQLQQSSSTIKDVDEYHEEDYELNPLDSMGLVTPRRKNKRSLCTPPPAPKSPNEYIVKRYVFTRGHNPDDSPSATRISMRTISHR
ncbi:hypothetical protein BGW42_006712 [Actinomortierella wolfii]|nr:hypothetical protein BGW42_006712 [Actinomortierella wolfii]